MLPKWNSHHDRFLCKAARWSSFERKTVCVGRLRNRQKYMSKKYDKKIHCCCRHFCREHRCLLKTLYTLKWRARALVPITCTAAAVDATVLAANCALADERRQERRTHPRTRRLARSFDVRSARRRRATTTTKNAWARLRANARRARVADFGSHLDIFVNVATTDDDKQLLGHAVFSARKIAD